MDLEDPVVLRNLAEPEVGKTVFATFKRAINDLTVRDTGRTAVEAWLRVRDTRPLRTESRQYVEPARSAFNKMVLDPHAGGFELDFAYCLDRAEGVAAFAKNDWAIGFRLDSVRVDGDPADYVPDFLVRTADGTIYVIETKARPERDLERKMARLAQWCADASEASRAAGGPDDRFLFVDQDGFQQNPPRNFAGRVSGCRPFQP